MPVASLIVVLLTVIPSVALAQPCTADERRVVDAIYQQMLGHGSAGADEASFARRLRSGELTVRELVRNVALSAEHRRRFLEGWDGGQGARSAAVTQLYLHLLARQPDAEGLRSHSDAIAAQGLETVVDSILESPEYQNAFGFDTVPGSRIQYCGPGLAPSAGVGRFSGMDRDRNGMVQRNEWNGSTRSFNLHDWNRDGVLAGDELRTGFWRGSASRDQDFDPFDPQLSTGDFYQMDRNRDNWIAPNEWFYDRESFWRSDSDRNGYLSLSEFSNPIDDERSDSFENLDVNRNGRVDRGEWHGTYVAFQWLDRNRDGVLSRTEMRGDDNGGSFDSFAGLDANGSRTLDPDEWRWSRRSFERIDSNRDGLISRQEFAAGTQRPRFAVPR